MNSNKIKFIKSCIKIFNEFKLKKKKNGIIELNIKDFFLSKRLTDLMMVFF